MQPDTQQPNDIQSPQQSNDWSQDNTAVPPVQPAPQIPQADWQQPQNTVQPGGQPPVKKSKTGLIIGLVVGGLVFLILCIGAVALLLKSSASKLTSDSNGSKSQQSSKQSDAASNAVTAKYSSDYEAVCKNGSITNAPAATKPYIIETFYTNDAKGDDNWSSASVGYGESYYPKSDSETSANVVACLSQKKGSAAMSKTCQFEDSNDKPLSIDYYSVEYTLTYYAAQTGKKIGSESTINGPATTCPSFASYSKTDPKLYGSPDDAAVEASHKTIAQ